MSSFSRRKVGVLVLVAVLLTPWATAADPGARADPQGIRAPWDLLARLWSAVTALWDDNGCGMDPFGECGTTSAPPEPTGNVDAGCHIDPYGGCGSGS